MTKNTPKKIEIPDETIEDILKSMEGLLIKYGEPKDLIIRLARAIDKELDTLHNRMEEIERIVGL